MRDCIFCGGSPLSREDVWPTWIARKYANSPTTVNTTDSTGKFYYRHTGVRLNQKARIVCSRACNNGWMSALEAANGEVLSALIEGKEIALNVPQQRQLEAWALKTTMVQEYTLPRNRTKFFRPAEHRAFARPPHETPVDTDVYLTDYRGSRYPFLFLALDGQMYSIAGSKPGAPNVRSLVATVLFGRMVLQVRSHRYREVIGKPSFNASGSMHTAATLLRLEPTVRFPNATGVDDTTVDEFMHGHFSLPR